jgi:hypothetical protein
LWHFHICIYCSFIKSIPLLLFPIPQPLPPPCHFNSFQWISLFFSHIDIMCFNIIHTLYPLLFLCTFLLILPSSPIYRNLSIYLSVCLVNYLASYPSILPSLSVYLSVCLSVIYPSYFRSVFHIIEKNICLPEPGLFQLT